MKLINLPIKFFIGIILLTIIFCNNSENKNSITVTLTTNLQEKNNLNHGIFLTEKLFKSKLANKNLSKKSMTVTKTNILTKEKEKEKGKSKINLTKNKTTKLNNQSNNPISFTGPILHKSWIKYIKFSGKLGLKKNLPTSFNENEQFFQQMKYFPKANLESKKDNLYEYIRDKQYFFLYLFENVISINSSLQV
jgi:hypothetical protein